MAMSFKKLSRKIRQKLCLGIRILSRCGIASASNDPPESLGCAAAQFENSLTAETLSDVLIWSLYYDYVESPTLSPNWFSQFPLRFDLWIEIGRNVLRIQQYPASSRLCVTCTDMGLDWNRDVYWRLARLSDSKAMELPELAVMSKKGIDDNELELRGRSEALVEFLRRAMELAYKLRPSPDSKFVWMQHQIIKSMLEYLRLLTDAAWVFADTSHDTFHRQDVLYAFNVVQRPREVPVSMYGMFHHFNDRKVEERQGDIVASVNADLKGVSKRTTDMGLGNPPSIYVPLDSLTLDDRKLDAMSHILANNSSRPIHNQEPPNGQHEDSLPTSGLNLPEPPWPTCLGWGSKNKKKVEPTPKVQRQQSGHRNVRGTTDTHELLKKPVPVRVAVKIPEAKGVRRQPSLSCRLQNQQPDTHKQPTKPTEVTLKVPETISLENESALSYQQQTPIRRSYDREHVISPRPQMQDFQQHNQREQTLSPRPRSRNSGRSHISVGSAEWLANRKFQHMHTRKTPDHSYPFNFSNSKQLAYQPPRTPSFDQSRTHNHGHSHTRHSHRHNQQSQSTTPSHRRHGSHSSARSNPQLVDSRAGPTWVLNRYLTDQDLIRLTSGCGLLSPAAQAKVHYENVKEQQRLRQQSHSHHQQRDHGKGHHSHKHAIPGPVEQSMQVKAPMKRVAQGPVVAMRTEWRLPQVSPR